MDDTSIQFRLRLAQINGIKLHEAAKKVTPEHLTPEYKAKLKELQDTAKTAQVARRNARDALEKANRDHDEAQKALFDHKTKDPNYFKRGNERLERSNQKAEAEHEVAAKQMQDMMLLQQKQNEFMQQEAIRKQKMQEFERIRAAMEQQSQPRP